MSTDRTHQAQQCLEQLRAQVDTGFSHLKALCSENGQLVPGLLDQQQKVSYELAFCVAELEASKAMLSYANNATTEAALCHSIALAFSAENIRTVWQRLLNHAHELGLQSDHLLTLMAAIRSQAFWRNMVTAASWRKLVQHYWTAATCVCRLVLVKKKIWCAKASLGLPTMWSCHRRNTFIALIPTFPMH